MNITVNLLGGLAVYHAGNPIPLPKSKRTRALLAYLIMTNRPHRRDRLCEVFWTYPDDIKGALRWSLSKIRPLVNSPEKERLSADRERVFLQSYDIDTDIDILTKKIKEETGTIDELKGVLIQLENPLLSALELPEQRLFQDWLISERNEISQMHCNVLKQFASHAELSLLEQLTWNKIWLDKYPYDKLAAQQLLNKLERLGRIKEYRRLSSELAIRFKTSGIKWQRSGKASNPGSVIDRGDTLPEPLKYNDKHHEFSSGI